MNLLENGCTRKKVFELIINSTEFKALADELGVNAGIYKSDELVDENPYLTAFVTRLYNLVLERRPAKAEIEAWVQALMTGKYSGAQVVRGFFKSKELSGRNLSKAELIRLMYKAILGREADNNGFTAWCDAYVKYGFEKVLNGFFGAREFAILAESYGIRAR